MTTAHTDHPMRHSDRTCPACNPGVLDRDKINQLARQAGLPMSWLDDGRASAWPELERFAALLAQDEVGLLGRALYALQCSEAALDAFVLAPNSFTRTDNRAAITALVARLAELKGKK